MKKRSSSNNVFCKFAHSREILPLERAFSVDGWNRKEHLENDGGIHRKSRTMEDLELMNNNNDELSFESIQRVLSELQSQTMLVSERLLSSSQDYLDDDLGKNNETYQSSFSNDNKADDSEQYQELWATSSKNMDPPEKTSSDTKHLSLFLNVDSQLDKENYCPSNNSFLNSSSKNPQNSFNKKELSFQTHKRSRPKEFIFEDEKECTFKPKINSSYMSHRTQNSSIPFADRMLRWQQRKNEQMKKKREELKKEEIKHCTFKPTVTTSMEMKSRNEEDELSQQTMMSTSSLNSQETCLKLYETAAKKKMEKQQQIENLKAEKMKECSFRPNIIVDPTVQPRYLNCSSAKKTTKGEPSCPSSERTPSLEPSSRPSSSCSYLKRPGSAPSFRGSRQCDSFNIGSDMSSRDSFAEFMERQHNTLKRKEEKVKSLKSSLECCHKPTINRMSQNITKHSHHQRIEDRVQNEKQRKEIQEKYMKAMATKDCTFKPRINKTSKQLPSRTAEEMSKGDLETKQQKMEEAKKMVREKELKDVTFFPKTNREVTARSVLRVSTDPDSYLERLRLQQEKAERRKNILLKEKEEKEMAECSFRPKLTHAEGAMKNQIEWWR
ncbi:hypothetical protein C9374_010063 [Naegleria lovaniensis]|uniref:Uncharacterized protein n=1 Tax=Naegleria lovaniensis TaxID=51637 RepID=A0AA88GI86_NAELO|nr:uncharacterized protein C9374_010063 [Naegleria lovaniensis]KAG2375059.1 hypothetical protein C9374_010063 [Naegleria lovaniensis]